MSLRSLTLDGLVCDLDGVVYRGSEVIPGAPEAIAVLREKGVRIIFATNNATHTIASYLDRLDALGIPAQENELLTCATVTGEEMTQRGWAGRSVCLIGSHGIKESLSDAGMKILSGDEARRAEVVVVSSDPDFNYDALRTANFALHNGAEFLATNDDATFPAADGLWPGGGAILAAVERAAGRTAEVMGKPNRPMMLAARRRLEGCQHIGVVGDQPATDLAGGRLFDWTTILVLTGVTSAAEAPAVSPAPDLIASDLAEVAGLVGG